VPPIYTGLLHFLRLEGSRKGLLFVNMAEFQPIDLPVDVDKIKKEPPDVKVT
jgi:hypothetical protein